MTALLVFALVIGAIFAIFVGIFRRRVQSTLERAGHKPPEELLQAARAAAPRPALRPVPSSRPGPAGVMPGPQAAPHFMLIYDVGPDFIKARGQYRDEHLALAWKAADAGELVLAGALEEPTEQAFLLFRGTRTAAERFAQADPYVRNGLVRQWRVKQWHTVVGAGAASPLRTVAKG